MSNARLLITSKLVWAAATALSLLTNAAAVCAQDDGYIEGFTEPYADIRLAASEMGTLTDVAVREGDQVIAGHLLANMDDQVLRAALEIAKAGMNSTGSLKSATADLQMRQVELRKLTELRDRNHASQQEVDRVTSEVTIAEARVQVVREELEIKRLEHERIKAQLRQREIRSPINGVVVEVFKDGGEFVSPSDPVVARIVQLDPLLVVFSVPVQNQALISKGQTVPMRIGSRSEIADGLVEYVSPAADASSGTVRVKVRLLNPNGSWHSGEKSLLLLEGTQDRRSPAVPGLVKRSR